jgi:hypothetical protein
VTACLTSSPACVTEPSAHAAASARTCRIECVRLAHAYAGARMKCRDGPFAFRRERRTPNRRTIVGGRRSGWTSMGVSVLLDRVASRSGPVIRARCDMVAQHPVPRVVVVFDTVGKGDTGGCD